MQYRTLGRTGWDVSAIGFGAWNIGGQWGEVDEGTAIDFVLAHPAVTIAIPGAKSPEQVRANAAAADGDLTDDELNRVQDVTAAMV